MLFFIKNAILTNGWGTKKSFCYSWDEQMTNIDEHLRGIKLLTEAQQFHLFYLEKQTKKLQHSVSLTKTLKTIQVQKTVDDCLLKLSTYLKYSILMGIWIVLSSIVLPVPTLLSIRHMNTAWNFPKAHEKHTTLGNIILLTFLALTAFPVMKAICIHSSMAAIRPLF